MIPTAWRPLCSAARACASANARPFAVGNEPSTTVQPLLPAGHSVSAGGGAVVCLGGVGCVPVEVVGAVNVGVVR